MSQTATPKKRPYSSDKSVMEHIPREPNGGTVRIPQWGSDTVSSPPFYARPSYTLMHPNVHYAHGSGTYNNQTERFVLNDRYVWKPVKFNQDYPNIERQQTYDRNLGNSNSFTTDGEEDNDGSEKLRGNYKCGRCGVPKKGHTCPYQPKALKRQEDPAPETRSIAVQVELNSNLVLRRLNVEIQGFPESYTSNQLANNVGSEIRVPSESTE